MIRFQCIVVVCLSCLSLLLSAKVAAQAHGDGSITISGELKQWHKITLTMEGPHAKESDTAPNPFTDYNFVVTFMHRSGVSLSVPGYFAADGNAGETSATQGNRWRAHFSPPLAGEWRYTVTFREGPGVALQGVTDAGKALGQYEKQAGMFVVGKSDKVGRDLRAHGRLQYVGKRYLQFADSGDYFLKAGADAPETLLAYEDFDGTIAANPKKGPIKSYRPHLKDWHLGDPLWKGGKGKGLIGAINYLSSTGCNAFSFLTYNAGGDGDNVWPFIERDKKLHYDCSKLDQWQVVFDHAQVKGMYLHFKLQETENDDNRKGKSKNAVPESLDAGKLGPERRLYLREIIARFGYLLALNWNLGEENTQTTEEQQAMANFIRAVDPYDNHIVLHTYPNQQDKIYGALLGDQSELTGVSLQNSNVKDCHWQTLKWVEKSEQAGKAWVVAFDEPGDASFGTPPDPDYPGMQDVKKLPVTVDDVRRYALWGTLMAGGSGVEYYFGYKLPENDLDCEDWRSRALTWRYSSNAIEFFRGHKIPFWEMSSSDGLINADARKNEAYCFAKPGEVYLVYLPNAGTRELDLTGVAGTYRVQWFNPRVGGALQQAAAQHIQGGGKRSIGEPPDLKGDWLAVIRRTGK